MSTTTKKPTHTVFVREKTPLMFHMHSKQVFVCVQIYVNEILLKKEDMGG